MGQHNRDSKTLYPLAWSEKLLGSVRINQQSVKRFGDYYFDALMIDKYSSNEINNAFILLIIIYIIHDPKRNTSAAFENSFNSQSAGSKICIKLFTLSKM